MGQKAQTVIRHSAIVQTVFEMTYFTIFRFKKTNFYVYRLTFPKKRKKSLAKV